MEPLGTRRRRHAGDLASCRARRTPRRARASQQEVPFGRAARRLPQPIPAPPTRRRITFEYVMLKGVNDSPAEARELVRLLKGIPAKINLIPFNPWPGSVVRVLGLGYDRALLRYRLQRRLRQPGADAARSRYPGRVRPTQERNGETAGSSDAGRSSSTSFRTPFSSIADRREDATVLATTAKSVAGQPILKMTKGKLGAMRESPWSCLSKNVWRPNGTDAPSRHRSAW